MDKIHPNAAQQAKPMSLQSVQYNEYEWVKLIASHTCAYLCWYDICGHILAQAGSSSNPGILLKGLLELSPPPKKLVEPDDLLLLNILGIQTLRLNRKPGYWQKDLELTENSQQRQLSKLVVPY